MSERTDIVYRYDGTFEGLLCCVFEGYEKKEYPMEILSDDAPQTLLYESKWIETDKDKAERVFTGIGARISPGAQELVSLGFLSCAPHKEVLIYRFLRLGFSLGGKVLQMLTDETVFALQKAVQLVLRESHKYKGFVRFSVYGEVLAAIIEPQNYVLSLLREHFCDRYRNEAFLIYDQTHRQALVYRPGEWVILPMEELELPPVSCTEGEYRRLWKRFYDTIAIQERENPRCRMNLMPKRYWSRLTELQELPDEPLLSAAQVRRLSQGGEI